jgi:hypothetical protein
LTSRYHAVLARVSPGYPPPLGRLSTCYSPVRRSTRVLLPGLARLACVRHAASVHSEPGSNSPVELSRSLRSAQCRLATALTCSLMSDNQSGRLMLFGTPSRDDVSCVSSRRFAVNLQRNHVVCLAILFSCQRADFVERAAVCRTLPSVSSRMSPCASRNRAKPFRLTRTSLTSSMLGI